METLAGLDVGGVEEDRVVCGADEEIDDGIVEMSEWTDIIEDALE